MAVMTPSTQLVTQLLIEWGSGNHAALEELMPLVYAELHKMARRYMNQQNPPHTLQTTALLHEAYLRLAGESAKQWQNRAHFFGVAAKAMRHVLVDHARCGPQELRPNRDHRSIRTSRTCDPERSWPRHYPY